MEMIVGGIAFVGFIAAHLFAVMALGDTRTDDRPTGRPEIRTGTPEHRSWRIA